MRSEMRNTRAPVARTPSNDLCPRTKSKCSAVCDQESLPEIAKRNQFVNACRATCVSSVNGRFTK